MLKEIKSYFKENFELDLVFIQCGCFYEVYEEDATFLEDNKDFKYKTYEKFGVLLTTGTHIDHLSKLVKKLDSLSLSYVFISQEKQDDQPIRVSTISTNANCLGHKFSRYGKLIGAPDLLSNQQDVQSEDIGSDDFVQNHSNIPEAAEENHNDLNLESLDQEELPISFETDETDLKIFLDPYDVRRVSIYHGLIQLPASLSVMEASSLVKEISSLPKQKTTAQEIFQAGALESLSNNNEDSMKAREHLQWLSNMIEPELQGDALYQQFFSFIEQSVTSPMVQGHSVSEGGLKYNPRTALRVFFDFNDYDFRDFEFGEHGWTTTADLSQNKQRIQVALSQLQGLSFQDSMKALESL